MTVSIDELPDEVQALVEQATNSLQPISPSDALDRFLDWKKEETSPETITEYRRKLGHFCDFCERKDIDNLNELDGRLIHDYRRYRRVETAPQSAPLSPKTMRDDMYLFRDFIDYLEGIDGVPAGLSETIRIPDLDKDDGVRNISIAPDRVEEILAYLDQYEYASRAHVIWAFYAHTGRRPSGLHALDLKDLHLEADDPYIQLRHRPEETKLKNNYAGEGEVYISEDVARIFRDYIVKNRVEVGTDTGREPFLTSSHGRVSKSTMRKDIYRYSRPCVITGECPHDRDIDSCEAAQHDDDISKCPSSVPPYALRHGYITSKLTEKVPVEILTDRCDVSKPVIEKHYDERDETAKRELRQKVLEEIRAERDGGGYL